MPNSVKKLKKPLTLTRTLTLEAGEEAEEAESN